MQIKTTLMPGQNGVDVIRSVKENGTVGKTVVRE